MVDAPQGPTHGRLDSVVPPVNGIRVRQRLGAAAGNGARPPVFAGPQRRPLAGARSDAAISWGA